MIKATYNIFGTKGEYTETVELKTTRDYQLLLKGHVTSSMMFLWNPSAPTAFKVHIVSKGLINTFAYNFATEIMQLLNDPSQLESLQEVFPIEVLSEG